MKSEKNISRIQQVISFCFLYLLMTSCGNDWKATLQEEVEIGRIFGGNIRLPLLVYAADAPIILIETSPVEMETEISRFYGIERTEAGKIIYDSMDRRLPIKVSSPFYQYAFEKSRIKVDLEVDSVYRQNGIRGVIDTYCRTEYDHLSLDHIDPFSDGYIIYLLSLHDIHVVYSVISDEDGIILKVIADIISDTSQYK